MKIFRLKLKQRLLPGEKVVADVGYRDERCSYYTQEQDLSGNWGFVRARHEAINKRLKQFGVLSRVFRHDISRHCDCFYAVANITYVLIKNDGPVFVGTIMK